MSQPINNNINYQKYFSNEINNVFENIKNVTLSEYPVKSITTEYFLFATLLDRDCLLYKTISTFLTFETISNGIYANIFTDVQDELIAVLKPGREIPFSEDFRYVMSKSYDIARELGRQLITSDIVLISIIDNHQRIRGLFEKVGFNRNIAINCSNKINEALNEIATVEPTTPKQQIQIQVIDPSNISSQVNVQNIVNSMFGSNQQKTKKNGYVSTYCTNLNDIARQNKIDPLIGRNEELMQISNILNRRKNNNVIVVGDSGVGKTHLVEGLVRRIVDGTAPMPLLNLTVYKMNVDELMAGTSLRGMFEERIIGIVKELSSKKNIIIFIDDFHRFINDKKKEEYDFASLLNELFVSSNIKFILTSSISGYKILCDSNENIAREFQKLTLNEPTYEENEQIINGIKCEYEKFHKVSYDDKAIKACVKLSERYIPERKLPASAIDILDESGAKKKLEIYNDEHIKNLLLEIPELTKMKEHMIVSDNIEESRRLETEIKKKNYEVSLFYDRINNDKSIRIVTEDDIFETISKHTDIDINKVSKSDLENLSMMVDNIKKEIKGQDEAIDVVTRAIKRSKVGFFPKNRPILSCMCIGSTGVGKTLLAKKLAKEVFGNEKNMLRFDMSEYSDKTSVNKLIGSSAGYVGYDKGGLLTEAVRNKKHTVLLIDELEKADEEVYNLFLQILDEGFLTDNTGNKIDFKNTIIIITSNVGAKKASLEKTLGFQTDEEVNKKSVIEKELKKKFPPEFLNRLDEIVYFNSLGETTLKEIIKLELTKLNDRIEEMDFSLLYDETLVEYIYKIIEKDKENGARPILRAIQNEIENKITDIIIDDNVSDKRFVVTVKDGKMNIA